MRAPPLPVAFFKNNRNRLLSLLPEGSLAVIWSNQTFIHNGDSTFPFKQNSSFYYLTGLLEEDAVLILSRRSGGDKEELLCVKVASELERMWLGKRLTLESAGEISGIETVKPLDQFTEMYHQRTLNADTLYFLLEEHGRSQGFSNFYSYNYKKFTELKERYPLHKFKRLAPLVNSLRMIKEPEEILMIEEAIRITISGLRSLFPLLKRGEIKEYALEAELIREFLLAGGEGFAFEPIVAGGERSCILHYTENKDTLVNGSHVLIDVGASYGSYHADLTRTFPVGLGNRHLNKQRSSEDGRFSSRFRAIYDAVVRVHDEVLGFMRPGLSFKDYHKKVYETMMEQLVHLGLITTTDEVLRAKQYQKYFMHGISHFLGLEVHDVGERDGVLKENMVLTLEPGIYVWEEGLGVRLENDILITETGARNLSANLPIERKAIEELIVG